MPRINLTRGAVALGVGVVDELLDKMDRDNKANPEPFQNMTDWARAGLAVGSSLAYMNGIQTNLAEPIMYASAPLLAKSTTRLVQEILSKPATAPAIRARATQRALTTGQRVPLNIENSEFRSVITQ